VAAAGDTTTPAAAPNINRQEKKLRHKQQRLLLLHHAVTCLFGGSASGEDGICPHTPHCGFMKDLWRHIGSCSNHQCTVQHCLSSRYMLSHYRSCQDKVSCPVCGPLFHKIERQKQQRQSGLQQGSSPLERNSDSSNEDESREGNIVENGRLMTIVPSSSSSSSMVALKSANLCPICLESVILPLPPSKQEEQANKMRIGATNCGHCFHADCFGKYERRCIDEYLHVPCPECLSTVTLFHPLYLDFGATAASVVDVPVEPQQPEGSS
jgi:hypothetical protein